MDFHTFQQSLQNSAPPSSLSTALTALWYDGKDDWDQAHHYADRIGGPNCDWVHAYLHRKEGDQWNAGYWYRRAGKSMPKSSLEEEWLTIVQALLS